MNCESHPLPCSERRSLGTRARSSTLIERVLPFGVEAIDGRLTDGGLSIGGLHEVVPSGCALAEDAAASLFVAGIASRTVPDATVIWAVTQFDLYAPALEEAGLSKNRIAFAWARDDRDVVAVMLQALRVGGMAAVVGEARNVSMNDSRRLRIAAADTGTLALLMRRRRRIWACPLDEPSAAITRWRIGIAPPEVAGHSVDLCSYWSVNLISQNGGDPFDLVVPRCDENGRLGRPAGWQLRG